MLHVVFVALVLSASSIVPASKNPSFSAEVARLDKLVKSASPNLDAVGAIKLNGKVARGYICIRAVFRDKNVSKRACVRMYRLVLGKSLASVTTGISKVVYERRVVDGQDCIKLLITESSVPVEKTSCLMGGDVLNDIIILDDNDPETQITAKIVCLGSACGREP